MGKYDRALLDALRNKLNEREERFLSLHGTRSQSGIRRHGEASTDQGYRQAFSQDVDRIMHSRAYTRYIDKTQVFYLIENDHVTHRVLHVQLVSKIARTIGRFLFLNEDLIEAIALGHDIGHSPFGHDGETFLSKICQSYDIGPFYHSVQSVRFLERVERKGKGWNLCLQTLDGILCHDGEIHDRKITPASGKTFETLDSEFRKKAADPSIPLFPMTLEGCVVRFSDTIAYVGRDFEDAIRIGLIDRSDIPVAVKKCLGDTNGNIVFNLVTDIIENSRDRGVIAFSPEISDALVKMKAFNLERIYMNPAIKKENEKIRKCFEYLFETCINDLNKKNRDSVIFRGFLDGMSTSYTRSMQPAEIVRDFISGMTDNFFIRHCPEQLRPGKIEFPRHQPKGISP